MNVVAPAASAAFFVAFGAIWIAAMGSLALGIGSLVSVARLPVEAFGPWWDNTRASWLAGIAVSFLIPFGTFVTGFLWFRTGKEPLRRRTGPAGRPFWAGPAKPYPPPPPWAWAPPPLSPPPPSPSTPPTAGPTPGEPPPAPPPPPA